MQIENIVKIYLLPLVVLLVAVKAYPDAAGIMPYSYSPHDGQAYMLLGYETFRNNGQGGWTDYGGTMETQDPRYNAAREFAEESRYVFGNVTPALPVSQTTLDSQTKNLQAAIDYGISHITSVNPYVTTYSNGYKYFQYFAHVDFMPEYILEHAYKFDGWDKLYHVWIPVTVLMEAIALDPFNPHLPKIFFEKKPRSGNHPVAKLFQPLAMTLTQPKVQAFIQETILKPPIMFLPYYYTEEGETFFLFTTQNSVGTLPTHLLDLSTGATPEMLFKKDPIVKDVAPYQPYKLFIISPPLHQRIYPVQISATQAATIQSNHPIKTVAGSVVLPWIRQTNTVTLDGITLDQVVYNVLHSKEGLMIIADIISANTLPLAKVLRTLSTNLTALSTIL